MSVVFAQGMRRSGTTILYDAVFGDRRFGCWYEPLNRARSGKGGGSRARDVDYQSESIAFRERFLAERGDASLDQDSLNWGAPRAPELEFQSQWPTHVRDLISALASTHDNVFMKFTRASHKVAELAALRPDAFFVHLVRDPRSVAQSHLFRRLPETRERIVKDGTFFTMTTDYDQWRAETMARHLTTERDEYGQFADEPAFVKVMLVWKELYTATRDAARAHFGDRHLVVWHDALATAPTAVLKGLYARLDMRLPWSVQRWAKKNVRTPRPWHEPDSPEWDRALDLLDLRPLISECEETCLR